MSMSKKRGGEKKSVALVKIRFRKDLPRRYLLKDHKRMEALEVNGVIVVLNGRWWGVRIVW